MKGPVAIEINEQYLKVALARLLKGKKRCIFDYSIRPISGLTDAQISAAISDILKSLKYIPRPLIVSIPRNFATVRNLRLPSTNPQEINQMMDLHIVRMVPYRKEEIASDHQALDIDSAGYTQELLAIVHKDVLRKQAKILEAAGFLIDKIFLSSYGVWQWTLANCSAQINASDFYLLLDIDSNITDFIVFSQKNLLFSRSISIDARQIYQDLKMRKLIGEIRQSLVIFQTKEANKRPAKIFLSGANSVIREARIGQILNKELDIPLSLVRPAYASPSVKGASNEKILDSVSLSAISEFVLEEDKKRVCFVLPELQIKKTLRQKARDLITLGSLLVYVFIVVCAIIAGRIYNQQAYLKRLAGRFKEIEKEVSVLSRRLSTANFIKQYLRQRRIPLVVLAELNNLTPAQIAFDRVDIDESHKVALRGQAQRLSEVFKFVTALEGSKYFEDVRTKYTRKRKVRGEEATEFEIELMVKH
jgi:Tfp pilus assembly PilM family ATPase/Tfp pilus assembly protein PilN